MAQNVGAWERTMSEDSWWRRWAGWGESGAEVGEKNTNEKNKRRAGAQETVVEQITERRLINYGLHMWSGWNEKYYTNRSFSNTAMWKGREAEDSRGRSGWTMSGKTWRRNIDLTRIGETTRNWEEEQRSLVSRGVIWGRGRGISPQIFRQTKFIRGEC